MATKQHEESEKLYTYEEYLREFRVGHVEDRETEQTDEPASPEEDGERLANETIDIFVKALSN